MNIMFLMGGVRADSNIENYPLYMTEINEKTILEQQVEYTNKINPLQLLFCVRVQEINQFHTDSVIKQIDDSSIVIPITAQTKGAICTALLGIEYIDNDEELILMAVDDFLDEDSLHIINQFRQLDAEAGVVSFNSIHPRYSFVKLDEAGCAIEFSEKIPISKNALVSFYYFKKGKLFVEGAKEVIRKDNPINNNFFISQVLNELILRQMNIVVHKISNEDFHPIKTERQMAEYISEINEKRSSK